MIKNRYKIIVVCLLGLILAVSFFSSEDKSFENEDEKLVFTTTEKKADTHIEESKSLDEPLAAHEATPQITLTPTSLPTDKASDDSKALVCTLSVSCESVLKNFEKLKENKKGIIPHDGFFLKEKKVEFAENETAFDVLHREMKNSGIHLEFVQTHMYNSAYIEGIGNLYEFDCGDYSGWLYKVNGVKPTYGCSQYRLQKGDRIEFYYSCNFLDDQD